MIAKALLAWILVTSAAIVSAGISADQTGLSPGPVVAKINGLELTMRAYRYFLNDARSNVISEISGKNSAALGDADLWDHEFKGKKAGEMVKSQALEAAIQYYALIAKAAELGVTTAKDEPFHGANMEQMRKNQTIYGPAELSESMVVSKYVSEVLKKGLQAKLVPENLLTEDEAKTYFDTHPEAHKKRLAVVIRKIYLGYEAGNKAEKKQLMEGILKRVRVGEDFAALAGQYSEKIKENPWVKYDEETGRQLIIPRGVEDPFLRKTFYDMEKGEVRGVADNGKGFYIVRCEEPQEVEVGFPEVRERLIATLTRAKMNDIVEGVKTTAKVEIKQEVYDAVIIN
jgi:parvulin-like peptidyl-prolyl isomerase